MPPPPKKNYYNIILRFNNWLKTSERDYWVEYKSSFKVAKKQRIKLNQRIMNSYMREQEYKKGKRSIQAG